MEVSEQLHKPATLIPAKSESGIHQTGRWLAPTAGKYLVPAQMHAVAQLVEVLCYKPEDHGFDSRWCHWHF
jgi:hypothetical protein